MNFASQVQFQVARHLADLFGHEWSGVPDEAYTWTVDEIRAYVTSRYGDSMAGIDAPTIMETENVPIVFHTTGTGRTSYVRPDGSVEVIISRPSGPVLMGGVHAGRPYLCYSNGGGQEAVDPNVQDAVYTRHVAALEDVVRTSLLALRAPNAPIDSWWYQEDRSALAARDDHADYPEALEVTKEVKAFLAQVYADALPGVTGVYDNGVVMYFGGEPDGPHIVEYEGKNGKVFIVVFNGGGQFAPNERIAALAVRELRAGRADTTFQAILNVLG